MQIQTDRDGSTRSFAMTTPHVLDGFYLDIPLGLCGQAEERIMFHIMSSIEPSFLMGNYINVNKDTGMSSSRYRLYFLSPTAPASLTIDGRMVEEIVFMNRCLRVYGKGWFFREKQLKRLDLDIKMQKLGASPTPMHPVSQTAPTATQAKPHPRPPKPNPKNQKRIHRTPNILLSSDAKASANLQTATLSRRVSTLPAHGCLTTCITP